MLEADRHLVRLRRRGDGRRGGADDDSQSGKRQTKCDGNVGKTAQHACGNHGSTADAPAAGGARFSAWWWARLAAARRRTRSRGARAPPRSRPRTESSGAAPTPPRAAWEPAPAMASIPATPDALSSAPAQLRAPSVPSWSRGAPTITDSFRSTGSDPARSPTTLCWMIRRSLTETLRATSTSVATGVNAGSSAGAPLGNAGGRYPGGVDPDAQVVAGRPARRVRPGAVHAAGERLAAAVVVDIRHHEHGRRTAPRRLERLEDAACVVREGGAVERARAVVLARLVLKHEDHPARHVRPVVVVVAEGWGGDGRLRRPRRARGRSDRRPAGLRLRSRGSCCAKAATGRTA